MNEQRRFLLHGWTLQVEARSPDWLEAVTEILGAYRRDDEGFVPPPGRILHARLGFGDGPKLPPTLCRKAAFETLVFHRDRAGERDLWIDVHGRGWVRIQVERGRLEADLELDPVRDSWTVAHHAFYPGLLELLKARGLFSVHAGLVSREGRGTLICGSSGSGKTTLALALAARGWDFLADDTCFLRADETKGRQSDPLGAVEGLAFWEDLHVTNETIEHFPALDFLKQQVPRRKNWKRHFAIGQLDSLHPVERCRPRLLIFPRVIHAGSSSLQPLSGAQAAVRLIPQSVVPVRRETTEAHLEIIGRLCRQVRSFELEMSDDLDEVTDRVEGLLAEVVR